MTLSTVTLDAVDIDITDHHTKTIVTEVNVKRERDRDGCSYR